MEPAINANLEEDTKVSDMEHWLALPIGTLNYEHAVDQATFAPRRSTIREILRSRTPSPPAFAETLAPPPMRPRLARRHCMVQSDDDSESVCLGPIELFWEHPDGLPYLSD